MDLERVRQLIIVAMCSDDELCEKLVLKGGNALLLIHGIGVRTSLDVDFSMEDDFNEEDLPDIEKRIFRALRDRFDVEGHVVFDERFFPQPSKTGALGPKWGGYRVEFKIISREKHGELGGDPDGLRRHAVRTDGTPGSSQIFKVEISKYEFCRGKEEHELDGYTVHVYTPAMIAAEKLRAICQQMPECAPKGKEKARSRDFYDIHEIVARGTDFTTQENQQLVRSMFAAKDVDLRFLDKIRNTRDFHAQDWPALELALGTNAEGGFDYYFESVVRTIDETLKPLWME